MVNPNERRGRSLSKFCNVAGVARGLGHARVGQLQEVVVLAVGVRLYVSLLDLNSVLTLGKLSGTSSRLNQTKQASKYVWSFSRKEKKPRHPRAT